MNDLQRAVVDIAISQIGVRETSQNRGPQVDVYLAAVGLDPTRGAYAWCAAFCCWVYHQAAVQLGIPGPLPRHASVLAMWNDLRSVPMRVFPGLTPVDGALVGAVFCVDHGHGKGHAGIVTGPIDAAGRFRTVEGNTSVSGSREGDGCYARTDRSITMPGLLGFIAPPYVPAPPLVA